MWYHCRCGKVKSGPPYRNSGYRPWLCERCKHRYQRVEGVPIIAHRGKIGVSLSTVMVRIRERGEIGRRNGLKIRSA